VTSHVPRRFSLRPSPAPLHPNTIMNTTVNIFYIVHQGRVRLLGFDSAKQREVLRSGAQRVKCGRRQFVLQ